MSIRNTPAAGFSITALFVIAALVGPWIAPYSPEAIDLAHQYELPSSKHWLGTADNGVDILSVLLHGARLAAVVGLSTVLLCVLIGASFGVVAAMMGRAWDQWMMGAADLIQAFPGIVLNIAILALVANPGVEHLIVALVASGWVIYARIARGQAMTLREREFVHAAWALGATRSRVMVRHVFPNLMQPLLVQATTGIGAAIVAESTLSFLGLGPGASQSWGALLDQGSGVLLRFPHVALIAGGTIAVTVVGFNLTGDWLRDRLDVDEAA